jgi:outer membrane protein
MSSRAFAFVLLLASPAFAQQSSPAVQAPASQAAVTPAPAVNVAPSAPPSEGSPAVAPAAANPTPATDATPGAAAPAAAAATVVQAQPSNVLTLAVALQVARAHQPTLRQAQASIAASRAKVDQAKAGLYPQVTATGAYQRTTANFVARPGALPSTATIAPKAASFKTFDFFNFGLTANQLVYDFGQTFNRRDAAEATVEARQTDEQSTRLAVEQNVRVAFFTARAAKAMLSVAHETLDNQERHLQQIEGFVRAGTRAQIDLAQAKTDRANATVNLINGENSYASAKATLNQAMGVERDTEYEVADDGMSAVDGEDGGLDPLVRQALKRRPEIASLQQQLRAQQLTLASIKGAYWPTLGVSTGATEAGRDLGAMTWNVNAGATVNWPLFQGGITNAQADEAQATAAGLRAQMETLEQQVRLDVEQARLGVRATKGVLVASDEVVINARERLRLAEGRYAAGIGNGIELADAQLAVSSALAQRVQAEYNLAAARAQLLHALGLP